MSALDAPAPPKREVAERPSPFQFKRRRAIASAYLRATGGEPDARVFDAYASAAGVQRVLASRGGALGALGAVVYQPSLQGVAISLARPAAAHSCRSTPPSTHR